MSNLDLQFFELLAAGQLVAVQERETLVAALVAQFELTVVAVAVVFVVESYAYFSPLWKGEDLWILPKKENLQHQP